jgi:hypothetical protein
MRAIFATFDHFMIMFVTALGVVWSTVFLPMLGGPLHDYEARAIDAGWQSLRSGEAANLGEAIEIAASIPVEVVFPSAHAAEPVAHITLVDVEPEIPELLGGPGQAFVSAERRRAPQRSPLDGPAQLPAMQIADLDPTSQAPCETPAVKTEACTTATARESAA